jgi:hypothetical protein
MMASASRGKLAVSLRLLAVAAAAWLVASLAGAQEKPAAVPAAAQAPAAPGPPELPLIEPAARESVKRMVATLEGAQKMSFRYENSYDTLQADGEMLEFGARGEASIRRPDRLRTETWNRSGRHVRTAWDGETVALLDVGNNVYASTPRGGDLDALIDFLRDEVGFKMPLADLFSSDLRSLLVENVVAARFVGKESLDGVDVEHVALRLRTGIDVQLWIRSGKHALPQRIVLNFSTADGRPQFRASFLEWDLDPWLRDGLFELDAPSGARRVPFALPGRSAAAQAAQEDAP